MTHEDYVSFEQAKALKELGFDWECQAYFEDYLDELNRHHRKFRFNAVANDMLHKDFYSAPTLAQAQKWLREVKGITILVSIATNKDNYITKKVFFFKWFISEFIFYGVSKYHYATYEQALMGAINKAIELLKEGINNEA